MSRDGVASITTTTDLACSERRSVRNSALGVACVGRIGRRIELHHVLNLQEECWRWPNEPESDTPGLSPRTPSTRVLREFAAPRSPTRSRRVRCGMFSRDELLSEMSDRSKTFVIFTKSPPVGNPGVKKSLPVTDEPTRTIVLGGPCVPPIFRPRKSSNRFHGPKLMALFIW